MAPHLVTRALPVTLFFTLILLIVGCEKDPDLFTYASEEEEITDTINTEDTSDESESSDDMEESADNNEDLGDIIDDTAKADTDYDSLEEALNSNDSWNDGDTFVIGGFQGGTFRYDAQDSSTPTDGGTVFVKNNGRLKRVWDNDGRVAASWYGFIPGNNNIDNKPYMDRIVEANIRGIVTEVQFNGSYNFDQTANWNNTQNLTIRGVGNSRTTFATDNLYQLFVTDRPNINLRVINIKFESTMTEQLSITQANEASLVYFRLTNSTNQVFDNCEWTAPNVFTNGVKYYVENGHQVDGVTFRNCHIHDLGRMGIETVNHTSPREVDRLRNLRFENNLIENTGLITSADTNGMGISLSGFATPAVIENNTFVNNRNCGVEIVGNTAITVRNNNFSGSGSPIHAVFSGSVYSTNVTIEGNVSTADDGNVFIGASNINSSNNQWTANQRFYYQDVSNINSNGDSYTIRGFNSNFGAATGLFQIGGNSSNITFENARIEATNDVGPFAGSVTTVNVISSDVYVLSNGAYPNNSNDSNVRKYVNGVLTETLN